MFFREAQKYLQDWSKKKSRKPLILRGARQVGKTTLIHVFSKEFDHYIYLNLEQAEDKKPFEDFENIKDVVQSIFFTKNIPLKSSRVLLFIDEIQESAKAIQSLRYFYEQFPDIYLISAGSLLEVITNPKISFPVGRVEYMVLRPVSFSEFLLAIDERSAFEALSTIPAPAYSYQKLKALFRIFAVIGGMPEIVQVYADERDLSLLQSIYSSLLVSYMEDVEKYAKNESQIHVLRHCIQSVFREAGNRIKFQNFGQSNYGSREIGESLRILERAQLIQLVYPTTASTIPIRTNYKKSPKLQVLDTGLLNHNSGLTGQLFAAKELSQVHNGLIAEHLVGQGLLVQNKDPLGKIHFWTREKKTSSAEVDFVVPIDNYLIPVEVKSGATGSLRSLHLFMDSCPHKFAIRIYNGPVHIDKVSATNQKEFLLLNLPHFSASAIIKYIQWFINTAKFEL